MLINNAGINPATYLNNHSVENTPQSGSQSISIKDILSSIGITSSKISELGVSPTLTAPVPGVLTQTTGTVTSFLKTSIQNADINQDLNALANNVTTKANEVVQTQLREQKAEVGTFFDISGMSSNAVALLAAANVLMLTLNQADTKLSGKLSLVSYDAAKTTASSMMREGMNSLSGSISQSALQLGITGVGAKLEYKGLQNERGALKHNAAKIDKLTTESHSIKNVLNGQNSVKLGAEGVDSLKSLNMKKTGADATKNLNDVTLKSNAGASATESLGVKDSNKQISPEHQTILSKRLESVESDIRLEQNTMDMTRIDARKMQMTGDLIMKNSVTVGGIAGSAGQYAAIQERSEQQISQVNNRVASTASDDARESSRKSTSLIQEMLKAMESINQSKASAFAAIAGNIRA
ncbi:IpaC/SipC family type III secretion system needle tip complex protein [Salmonella enterica subsp. salamae]|uniref:IpaC/SipC family type III secretion system needle tip complex protein n=1 Tax=Salmonella enterica subsp. salamae TaxID=59202 RepID=A0A5Y3UXB8_SALER|nr:IpaC/SipC family type III secretion system needle tip complex protein [Salmonella enterica subsp. salamae]EEO8343056.1 IpaC/SipC family type III secretion system needle tip complex protein [Salmonella enterica]ECI3450545.1 IpaC/SipC family type III secretion system needle tip complex protein [Salmonella enterica subsp. salamae]ECJ2326191.1 IpaC/SipC family type III secretion system needle tip complex protein [Salmonella enterica subsp. salamae]EIC8292589.1 IpaC/SipC family type III secretion